MTFTKRENLAPTIAMLVPMRRLSGNGLQCPLGRSFPTITRTVHGEITKTISYALLVEGCALVISSAEEVAKLRENEDDPLGDG